MLVTICESSTPMPVHDAADDRQVDQEAPERWARGRGWRRPRKPGGPGRARRSRAAANARSEQHRRPCSSMYSQYGIRSDCSSSMAPGWPARTNVSRPLAAGMPREHDLLEREVDEQPDARRRSRRCPRACDGALPRRAASRCWRSARPRPRTVYLRRAAQAAPDGARARGRSRCARPPSTRGRPRRGRRRARARRAGSATRSAACERSCCALR